MGLLFSTTSRSVSSLFRETNLHPRFHLHPVHNRGGMVKHFEPTADAEFLPLVRVIQAVAIQHHHSLLAVGILRPDDRSERVSDNHV